jgi:cytochrome P450
MSPLFGDGIFIQEGEEWHQSRNLLRRLLQCHNYEDLNVFKRNVDVLIEDLSNQTAIVDLQPLFFRLTFDISKEYLFGNTVKSLTAHESASEQAFSNSFDTALAIVAKRFRLSNIYWMIGGSRFRQACSNVHRLADQMIDRSRSSRSSQESSVFLDQLAEEISDRDVLRGQMINLLAAGRDTTACLLTWTFFLLVRHPRVLKKLREEIITKCLDTASLTSTDLRQLFYLQNVLRETLRLYPSIPINDRRANKDTFLPTGGGPDRTAPVFIPKGKIVTFSTYALHRRPDLYGMDAELFRPERWDEYMPMHHGDITKDWGYLPFNNGSTRTCIGSRCQVYES